MGCLYRNRLHLSCWGIGMREITLLTAGYRKSNMPRVRQLIPPLTLLTPDGKTIHAWDFKQKRNIVIGFLDAGCPLCEAFVRALSGHSAELREKEATGLLAFPEGSSMSMSVPSPPEIIVGSDIGNQSIQRFLGEDALSPLGLARRAVFVTDRYGEIAGRWIIEGHDFPTIEQILSSLNQVEIACEECEVPFWPAEE